MSGLPLAKLSSEILFVIPAAQDHAVYFLDIRGFLFHLLSFWILPFVGYLKIGDSPSFLST